MTFSGARYEERSAIATLTLITKKGKGKAINLNDRLMGITYTDSGKRKSTKIEATLINDDNALLYNDELRKGAIFGLRFGYPNLMVDAGQFVMKEPRGRDGIYTITATERKRSKMSRKKLSRQWETVRRSDAVADVLRNHFPAGKIHVESTTLIVPSITQTDEHDWQFCARQAQLAHYEFYIAHDGVHWEKPKRKQRPAKELRYVKNAIDIGNIKDYSFEGLGSGIPGRVTLKGKDAVTKKPFTISVDKETADDYDELVETLGADSPEEGDAEEHGDTGYEIVRNTGARSETEARELANSIFKTNRYGAMKLSLQTVGDPTLRSRTIVVLSGMGTAFDGLWWIKEVKHTIRNGYQQEIQLTREGLGKKLGRKAQTKSFSTLDERLRHIQHSVGGAMHAYYPANHHVGS